jgi:hypothetical protein
LEEYPHYSQITLARNGEPPICGGVCNVDHPMISSDSLAHQVTESRDLVREWAAGQSGGRSMIISAFPIFDDQNRVQGMIDIQIDLSSIDQLAKQLNLPPDSAITIRDDNGTILARFPDPQAWVGRSFPDAPIAQVIKTAGGEGSAESVGIDGIRRLYGFTSLTSQFNRPITISVGIPAAVAFADADRTLARDLIALGIFTVLVFIAAWIGQM